MSDSKDARSKGGGSKDSAGWKRTVLTSIIIALIPVLFGGSALVSFIISVFYTPNISINWITHNNNEGNSSVSFLNRGGAAATNVLLTVQSPSNDTSYRIFSTENYTLIHEPHSETPWILQLRVPRFATGQGSVVSVDFSFDKAKMGSHKPLVAYTTYDQGSSMTEETKANVKTSPVGGPWDTLANSVSDSRVQTLTILTIISAIISVFIASFIETSRKLREGKETRWLRILRIFPWFWHYGRLKFLNRE